PAPMTPTRRPLSAAIAAPSARLRMPEEEWRPYTKERGSRGALAELFRRRFRLFQAVLWRNPRCACQLFLSPALWLWASLRCPPTRLPRFRISASLPDRQTSLKPPSAAGAARVGNTWARDWRTASG